MIYNSEIKQIKMKTIITILVSIFFTINLNAQDGLEKKSSSVNSDNPENTMKQSIDIGVTNVSHNNSNTGKHHISVTYKNFGNSIVTSVQLKYKINNRPSAPMNVIPGTVGVGQTKTDPKIPFNNIGFTISDGLIVGQVNTFQVCTVWNDANNGNNCKTISVFIP
jgi:hypothetical protein